LNPDASGPHIPCSRTTSFEGQFTEFLTTSEVISPVVATRCPALTLAYGRDGRGHCAIVKRVHGERSMVRQGIQQHRHRRGRFSARKRLRSGLSLGLSTLLAGAALTTVSVVTAAPASAATDLRYSDTLNGGATMVSNAFFTRSSVTPAVAVPADTDNDDSTSMSSSADLVLPPGSTIEAAYLYA